ncbi:MAG: hypothetical protein OEY77_02525 [Nitrospira sp.]|nr:hypothetical protein [Nitrospira sp.]
MSNVWGDAIVEAFRDMMMRMALFLPKLLALLSFLVLGVLIGLMMKAALHHLLRAAGIDGLSERLGLQASLAKAGFKQPFSQIVGRLAFWTVFVIFVFMGVDALGLPTTADLMGQLLGYLPSVIAAGLLILVGVLLGNFLAEATLIAMVNAQIQEARFIAGLVRWGIFLFTAAMVLTQLGIAKEIVVAAFSIVFGGVVIALAIAVGLGGRNIARDALERRWGKAKDKTKAKDNEEQDEMVHL